MEASLVWSAQPSIKFRSTVGTLIVYVFYPDTTDRNDAGWRILDSDRDCKQVAEGRSDSLTGALREAEEAALKINGENRPLHTPKECRVCGGNGYASCLDCRGEE